MAQKPGSHANESHDQLQRFKELARELGCEEDEGAFESALKKLAEAKPLPRHEPKKRKAKSQESS
jgi:hypothetical protein